MTEAHTQKASEYKKNLIACKKLLYSTIPYPTQKQLEGEIENYNQLSYKIPSSASYKFHPKTVHLQFSSLTEQYNLSEITLHKLILISFMEHYETRAKQLKLTNSIIHYARLQFIRILSEFGCNKASYYDFENDLFQKDLGICNGRLWPTPTRLIKYRSGIPRRLLFTKGIGQFLKVLKFLILDGKQFSPSVEIHVHPRMLNSFTQHGWKETLLLIAEMMIRYPDVQLLQGAAWFYDPKIEEISPHLSYIRQIPLSGGAITLFAGHDDGAKSSALAKSEKRRKLCNESLYLPATYYLLWSRKKIIAWYNENR
jgi:hypothetical protein